MAQHLIMVDQTKASIHYTRLLTFLNHHMHGTFKTCKNLYHVSSDTPTHTKSYRERERRGERERLCWLLHQLEKMACLFRVFLRAFLRIWYCGKNLSIIVISADEGVYRV